MNTIQCPHCKKQVELSEAIIHEFQTKIREEEKKNLKIQFEKQKVEEQAEQEKRLRLEFEQQNKDQLRELEERKKSEANATKREKELLEQLAREKEERERAEEKIKGEARKKVEEEVELKLKQKDLQLEQARKANQDLQRKLEQGSQQLQGEALELNLEEKLKAAFPTDEFLPVPKGVEGGDIWQKIKFRDKVVGTILWETKQTKAWSKGWLIKLKEDVVKINATEAILVSQVLPTDSSHFDRKDGVWITTYEHAISICRYVRFLITTVNSIKSSTDHTEEEWGQIRDYMMSESFKNRMQSHFDNIRLLRTLLDAEKRSTIIKWKKQESIIEKMDRNTISFYGELKTIVVNLPELNGVETFMIEDEKDTTNEADF
ncbi:MAG TPA: DUF2130 domain-containing protein [Candidatus Sulfotelmatobacter sp.]|jgi:hypothetical protein|nr:DUF2130 domain-containing protein [Candidatus Sulfotelmatobacter sp.]